LQVAGGLAVSGPRMLMFAEEIFQASAKIRTGGAQWFAEVVATFGLVFTILRR
jgi:glycerol uptake facilitator-like aquaporin